MASTSKRTPSSRNAPSRCQHPRLGMTKLPGLPPQKRTMLHNLVSPSKKEKNNVVRTICHLSPSLPPFHTFPCLTMVFGTERNLRKPVVLSSNIHLENLSRKTVKKCCRDNQFRGRPRMNPSALAPTRDSSKFAHSTWSAPSYGEETSTQQSRGCHSHAPWVSHHSVPSWLRPTNLVYVCVSRLYETHPWRAASFGLPNVVCRSFVSRSTDGDGRDILSRAASCSSCFLHRFLRCSEWSTPLSRPRLIESIPHLTVGRNLHMKDAGTITSHPGGASGLRRPRWRDRHMVSNRGHCVVVKPLVRVGFVGTTPANHCTRLILAQGFEL